MDVGEEGGHARRSQPVRLHHLTASSRRYVSYCVRIRSLLRSSLKRSASCCGELLYTYAMMALTQWIQKPQVRCTPRCDSTAVLISPPSQGSSKHELRTHIPAYIRTRYSFSRSFSVYPNINESIMVCFFMGLSDIYWPGNSRTFLVRQGPRKRRPIFRRRRHFPYGPQVEHHIAFRATFTATSSQPK